MEEFEVAAGVAIAALANKLARTIWAVLAKGRYFDPAAFCGT
jgi:hypothetical protein